MSEPLKVEIQGGAGRRLVVLSHLTEHWSFGVVPPPPDKAVTDEEIENFLRTITPDERNRAYRRFAGVVAKNAAAALKRLHPPKHPQYGRVTTNLSPIQDHEVPRGIKPGGRDKQ